MPLYPMITISCCFWIPVFSFSRESISHLRVFPLCGTFLGLFHIIKFGGKALYLCMKVVGFSDSEAASFDFKSKVHYETQPAKNNKTNTWKISYFSGTPTSRCNDGR